MDDEPQMNSGTGMKATRRHNSGQSLRRPRLMPAHDDGLQFPNCHSALPETTPDSTFEIISHPPSNLRELLYSLYVTGMRLVSNDSLHAVH
ncbi:unnamed protein product [Leptosia nina]|uniref:Uncharacterized protein n=1 Tax=Leptosia nina TaxID=320188 RepID=A0AAV1JR60_9NEOP